MQVFSIFDKKALVYNTPFFAVNDRVAVRSLCDLCSDSRSFVSKHPEDYALYFLGSFDDSTGVVAPTTPSVVCEASACMPPVTE